MRDTKILKTDIDWLTVKNECRTTVNKDASEKEPTDKFKRSILIAEHSPIRAMSIMWSWNIKSWVATHFARHWLGWDKWISTQRSDRTGVNRDELPQSATVKMDIKANPQSLINVGRFRLCYQASPETREKMEDLKMTIHDEVDTAIADVIVPNCIYRWGCPEMQTCENSIIGAFVKWCNENNKDLKQMNIQNRYDLYNEWFYETHKGK